MAAPGRAGGALALAAEAAGHRIVGVDQPERSRWPIAFRSCHDAESARGRLAGDRDPRRSHRIDRRAGWRPLPAKSVARSTCRASNRSRRWPRSCRLGIATGSFHPLQSLSDPETGARSLAGAWAGLTATEPLFGVLADLAIEPGDDSVSRCSTRSSRSITPPPRRPPTTSSPPSIWPARCSSRHRCRSRPWPRLTRTAVANAFAQGPRQALTGPDRPGRLGDRPGSVRGRRPDSAGSLAAIPADGRSDGDNRRQQPSGGPRE